VATPSDLGELPRYVGGTQSIFDDLIGPSLSHAAPLGNTIALWNGELTGEEKVGELDCVRLRAPPSVIGPARVARSWWLAPSRGYALAQCCECGTWATGSTASKRTVNTVEEWIQTPDAIWVPRVVTKRVYIQQREGEEQLGRVDRTELVSWAINVDIADDVFEIELPETTEFRQID
jgi:hypothetical protein